MARFKKGQSGNPTGRPKIDPIVRKFQDVSNKELVACLTEFCSLSAAQVKEIYQNADTTMFRLVCARILNDAANGKSDARTVLLERLCGKVTDKLDISGDNHPQVIITLPSKDQ